MGRIIATMSLAFIVVNVLFTVCAQEYDSDNQIIEADTGQTFIITIGSNHTTGYQWNFAAPIDKKILEFIGSRYIPPKKNLPGAGGKEEWSFKAIAAGTTTIMLEYMRPWAGDPSAKKVIFTVIVR